MDYILTERSFNFVAGIWLVVALGGSASVGSIGFAGLVERTPCLVFLMWPHIFPMEIGQYLDTLVQVRPSQES